MKNNVRRALAAATICGAVTAALATSPYAAADQARAKADPLTNFGMKGTAVGVKLVTNNVQTLTANDAVAPLRCTRLANRTPQPARSILSTPENSLIDLSSSTSRTVSYRIGDRVGVRATNELGDITLGGTLPGSDTSTPLVVLKGLTTTADAFHDKSGYGHEESFTAPKLAIDTSVLTDNGVPIPAELQDLLDTLADTGNQLTTAVIDVLEQVGAPIEIPQLGTIGLGRTFGHANSHRAESDARALEFKITATGEDQLLRLGWTRAVIGGPAPSGVFRSTSMPLDLKVADGALHFGNVRPRTIPCEGTHGKTRSKHLDSASVVLPQGLLIGATGIDSAYMGNQFRNGSAKGFDSAKIGELSIPALDLTITGISSKVNVRKAASGNRVKATPHFSVTKIMYQGNEIPLPARGHDVVVDGLGAIRYGVVEQMGPDGKWGMRATALRVTLTDYNAVLDLGIAASQIFAY